jgi:hypothetical protein
MNQITEDSKEVVKFLWKHYPYVRKWVDPLGYAAWHLSHGFMAIMRYEPGTPILGVVAARPVANPSDAEVPFQYSEEGPCIFVELAVHAHPMGMAAMAMMLQQRFGMRSQIAWFRHDKGPIRIHDFERTTERVKKMIGTKNHE